MCKAHFELARGSTKSIALLRVLLAVPPANKNEINNSYTNECIQTAATEGKKKTQVFIFPSGGQRGLEIVVATAHTNIHGLGNELAYNAEARSWQIAAPS